MGLSCPNHAKAKSVLSLDTPFTLCFSLCSVIHFCVAGDTVTGQAMIGAPGAAGLEARLLFLTSPVRL